MTPNTPGRKCAAGSTLLSSSSPPLPSHRLNLFKRRCPKYVKLNTVNQRTTGLEIRQSLNVPDELYLDEVQKRASYTPAHRIYMKLCEIFRACMSGVIVLTVAVIKRVRSLVNDYQHLILGLIVPRGYDKASIRQSFQLIEDDTVDAVISPPEVDLRSHSLSPTTSASPQLLELDLGSSNLSSNIPVKVSENSKTSPPNSVKISERSVPWSCKQSTDDATGVSRHSTESSVLTSDLSEPCSIASSRTQSTDYGLYYYRRMGSSLELETPQAGPEIYVSN